MCQDKNLKADEGVSQFKTNLTCIFSVISDVMRGGRIILQMLSQCWCSARKIGTISTPLIYVFMLDSEINGTRIKNVEREDKVLLHKYRQIKLYSR